MSDDMNRTTSLDRPVSSALSQVSDTSDRSKDRDPYFKKEPRRSVSPGLSQNSDTSDWSKGHGPDFSNDPKRPVSSALSQVSDTSDRSKDRDPYFQKEPRRSVSPGLSQNSDTSDWSKGHGPDFSNDPKRPVSSALSQVSDTSDRSKDRDPYFQKEPRRSVSPGLSQNSDTCDWSKGHGPDLSNDPKRKPSNNELENSGSLSESASGLQKEQTSEHHETPYKGKKIIEHVLSKDHQSGHLKPEVILSVLDIFKPKAKETVRTVLTTGEVGIGKSSLVQELEEELSNKSLLKRKWSWLKGGKSDVILFPVKLSELNTTDPVSLVGLLNSLFDETKTWTTSDYENDNIIVVLEGLDHCKFQLDFTNNAIVTDLLESTSVDVILTNLISGKLLPSARIWITSIPLPAAWIPENLIDRKTELRENAKTEIFKRHERAYEQYKQEVKRHTTDSELYQIRSEEAPRKIRLSELFARSRTVLTKGIPGIGKTFQTNKFRAENVKNKLVFSFDLSELSQTKERKSMESLLCKHFDLKDTKGCYFDEYEMVVILDGLEKYSLPLDFENNVILKDIKTESSVDVLLTNLIEGSLLPSAHVWILTQPSAVNKIPPIHIDKVTECQETPKRRKKLWSHLKMTYKNEKFQDNLEHDNQKNTEHILRTYEAEDEKKVCINKITDLYTAKNSAQIRTVLTIGEPGIGKTYLVQKLKHDWAHLTTGFLSSIFKSIIFPLQCSKLHLEKKASLVEILNNYFKGANKCVIHNCDKLNIVFVLDGLDELQKLPLDFDNNDIVTDVHQPASVDVILTNLIKGKLLPEARIWITSRPAAAARMPEDFVHRKTEIREKPDLVSQRKLKEKLKDRFNRVAEGVDRDKASVLLKEIFTDLYIIEGESGEVFQHTDSRQVQQTKNKEARKEIPISYKDIFKPSSETPNAIIKTVLTTGVAGIGKTFSSMKYMLDWAESSTKGDIFFAFPLPFRELNLRKDTEHSLEELIYEFFPPLKKSEIKDYSQYKIMIVLDGLDECRLDLNFAQSLRLSDITQKASVRDILMNLIQGNLLPNSQIWITSRPAASLCLPADQVDRVTEVRGFNDEQKEEYFRKRFSDKDLAERILKHVKESRSIYIMCQIPVFSWIAAKVLEEFEKQNKDGKDQQMPKTLTDLYIHFLLLQCRQANAKFSEEVNVEICWTERNKNTVLSLGKLAFEELEKGNLLFTEDDLNIYGLDVEKAVIFSGLLTQIVQDDGEVCRSRFFSFVHMSLQEFLGAFYAVYTFHNEGRNVLVNPPSEEQSASVFYKTAIDKALESKSGKWDMFLRFLLGLSLETNQRLFQNLLQKSEDNEKTNKETITYIKAKIDEESSDAEENMNLFHCLNELNDRSLVEEVKKYLSSETTDFENFSASKWSALTFVLLTSEEKLDVFDLKKYLKSEKVLLGMLPVVKVSTTALLSWCDLSELSCDGLSSSVLASASSNLTELNLSHNDLLDAGLEKLSKGLKSLHCKIETLRLSGCQISVKGCSDLVKAVRLNKSCHLKEVDLSYNHPGEDGIKMLKDLVDDQTVKLNKVCVDFCGEQRLKPGLKKYAADLTLNTESANQRLVVTDDKRRAKTWRKVEDRVLKTTFHTTSNSMHPETSEFPNEKRCKCSQVFCEQKLSALWYWEVEWSGTVGIGVTYKGASTTNIMGRDDKSWCVFCTDDSKNKKAFADEGERKYSSKNNKTHRKKLWFSSKSHKKMAVFLNWEEGSLTYYDVTTGVLNLSEPIHTFHTKFEEPLVPGFWFKHGSVRLCEIV